MKIKRKDLNRIIENYISNNSKKQQLNEVLNIQWTLNKINPYFLNPDAREEEYEVDVEKVRKAMEEGSDEDLPGTLAYFKKKQAKIKRDVEKMGQGRRGRYNELEAKIFKLGQAIEANSIPVPDNPPEPPEIDQGSQDDGGDSGGEDPWEYEVDKEGVLAGSLGCWVTRKRGTQRWIKIKGNPRITNWQAVMDELDNRYPGRRTDQDKRNCSGKGSDPGGDRDRDVPPSSGDEPDEGLKDDKKDLCSTLVLTKQFERLKRNVMTQLNNLTKNPGVDTLAKLKERYPTNTLSAGNAIQRFFLAGSRGSYTADLARYLKAIIELEKHCAVGSVSFVIQVGDQVIDSKKGGPSKSKKDALEDLKTYANMFSDSGLIDDINSFTEQFNDDEVSKRLKDSLQQDAQFVRQLSDQILGIINGLPQPISESRNAQKIFKRWMKNAKLL